MLRLKEVMHRTGLSKSSLYAFIAEGTFPSPVPLGRRAVGWIKREVDAWLAERVRDSRSD